jgi:hypothetical protein
MRRHDEQACSSEQDVTPRGPGQFGRHDASLSELSILDAGQRSLALTSSLHQPNRSRPLLLPLLVARLQVSAAKHEVCADEWRRSGRATACPLAQGKLQCLPGRLQVAVVGQVIVIAPDLYC